MIGADRAARGILSLQDSHIFHIPFNFTSIVKGVESTQRIAIAQGDLLIYGITTWNSNSFDHDPARIYWLKWRNREYNQAMMTGFVDALGIIQTDAQNVFRFPSPWFVRNGTYLDMTLRNPTDADLGTLTGSNPVTTEHVFICEVFPRGYEKTTGQKLPQKQPFIFSYMSPLGFQEDTTTGGNVVDSSNLYPSYQASWPPLLWDFELTSVSLDSVMWNYDQIANLRMLQIIERKTKRQIFVAPCTNANVAGGRSQDAFAADQVSVPTGWNKENCLTHNLPVPVFCKKGSQLTAKVSFNLNYTLSTVSQFSNLNEVANICLLGNKFEDMEPPIGMGPFSKPPTYAT